MELSSTIIGITVLVIAIAPFIILQRSAKKRKLEIQRQFVRLAESKGVVPDLVDFWNDRAIGLDSVSKRVLFTENLSLLNTKLIDLKQVKNIEREVIYKKVGTQKVVDRVRLAFYIKSEREKTVNFEFYNQDIELGMNGEIPLMDKWYKYLQDVIKYA